MTHSSAANMGGVESNPDMGNRNGSTENNANNENNKEHTARVRKFLRISKTYENV